MSDETEYNNDGLESEDNTDELDGNDSVTDKAEEETTDEVETPKHEKSKHKEPEPEVHESDEEYRKKNPPHHEGPIQLTLF